MGQLRLSSFLRTAAAACMVIIAMASLSSCQVVGFIAAENEQMNGKPVTAEYHGLSKHSVAIVVYAAPSTIDEFPSAREDISSFLATKMRLNMPDVRLLNYREITRWQDDTVNWFGMTEKEIGKHFGVDRVLYVELLAYSSRMEGGYGDLQGHLRANCKIFEMDTPGDAPAWTGLMDVTWPKDRPLEPNQMSEVAVRKRTLDIFAEDVVNKLYDHKEFEKSMKDE